MKLKIICPALAVAAVLLLTGCTGTAARQPPTEPVTTAGAVVTSAQPTTTIPTTEAPTTTIPVTAAQPVTTYKVSEPSTKAPQTAPTGGSSSYVYIGTAAAKKIALADAGFEEKDVRFEEVSIDRDGGRIIYSVEFISGIYSYEYEIDAISSVILERDREVFD